jgi:hypothetical protein
MLDAYLQSKVFVQAKEDRKVIEDDFSDKIHSSLNAFSTFGSLTDDIKQLFVRIIDYF